MPTLPEHTSTPLSIVQAAITLFYHQSPLLPTAAINSHRQHAFESLRMMTVTIAPNTDGGN
jgi:hypothetical protein